MNDRGMASDRHASKTPKPNEYNMTTENTADTRHCPPSLGSADRSVIQIQIAPRNSNQDNSFEFLRGPLESTTGMVRVKVTVQREQDGLWYALVGSTIRNGSTRREAIRAVLNASSVPLNKVKGVK